MKTLAINKRASFDYFLHAHIEAGIVLSGQEVRSVKTGHISLKGSFVTVKGSDLYLTNANIPPYIHAGEIKDYDPTRPRKLLLHKNEINSFIGKNKAEGMTLIPTRVYVRKRKIKVEIASATGKKKYDKRDAIAKRDSKRRIERTLRAGFSSS